MLQRLKNLRNATVLATDGEIGTINDIYFDDDTWTVRYLIVDPGMWLGRLVLVSPVSLDTPDWQSKTLPTHLSRQEVENSPDLLGRGTLSRAAEADLAAYYGYPYYWGGPELWGWAGAPGALRAAPPVGYVPPEAPVLALDATSLYSGSEISGYHIHAIDGEIGHVDDFIVDDETWSVRYLQIDTSNWIGGKTVLVATRWVTRVDTADGKLHVDLTRDRIEGAPEFDPEQEIDRTYEERLHTHYGLPAYWESERARARAAGRSA